VASNSQGFLAFVATLIKRRLDDETPPKPSVAPVRGSTALPGVAKARHAIEDGGTGGLVQWLTSATRLLVADATIDRLQSPMLGGPVRTAELCAYAAEAVRLAPELNVLDVTSSDAVLQALADARECPFRRIEEIRKAAPGFVLRASISAAAALGRHAAPRNALSVTAAQLVDAGISILRVADPYNDPSRLAAAAAAASKADALVEGAVNVSGSLHPTSSQIHVERVVAAAQLLDQQGVNAVVVEDRCGLLRPVGAYTLVRAIRREVSLPIWVRVVDAGGWGLATLVAAVEAGAIGVDTVMPCLAGNGLEPQCLAVINALSDTERRPDIDPLALATLDEQLERICAILGGWHAPGRIPPDAPDRELTPQLLETVLARCGGPAQVSLDHVLAACDAARHALGKPSMVPPANHAVANLAAQMIEHGMAAGPLIDRSRADDPEGMLDSMGSLREGGFPEGTIEEQAPASRNELLQLLWGDVATKFFEHQSRFGHLELLPSEPLRYGIGPGERLTSLVNGEPYDVLVVSVDEATDRATVELNGRRHELRLSPPAA
jgi:pyruvate carboxylase